MAINAPSELAGKLKELGVLAVSVIMTLRAALPAVMDEIVAEILRQVPTYSRQKDGIYEQVLRDAVRQMLESFLDLLANPLASLDDLYDKCVLLSKYEAGEGRHLNELRTAYRLGCKLGLDRLTGILTQAGYSPESPIMATLNIVIDSYNDMIARWSSDAYETILQRTDRGRQHFRAVLLHAVVSPDPLPESKLREHARYAGWTQLPEFYTPIAIQVPTAPGEVSLKALEALDHVLADLEGPEPCLLAEGEVDEDTEAALVTALPGCQLVIGATVALAGAAPSLHCARLVLARFGGRADASGSVPRAGEYDLVLPLLANPAVADITTRRMMDRLRQALEVELHHNFAYFETFDLWLDWRLDNNDIASIQHISEGTVRRQVAAVKKILGNDFGPDAYARFGVVLRWMRALGYDCRSCSS